MEYFDRSSFMTTFLHLARSLLMIERERDCYLCSMIG